MTVIDIKASGEAYEKRSVKVDPKDRIKRPSWLDQYTDSLAYLFFRIDTLLENGRVVPSAVVLANDKLYHRRSLIYRKDHPAYFVYSHDRYYAENTSELEEIASKLLEISESEERKTKEEKRVTAFFTGEKNRPIHKKVPELYTEGREVFFTTTVVCRKHLKGGKLSEKIYPMLVVDDDKADAMMLPCRYWAEK